MSKPDYRELYEATNAQLVSVYDALCRALTDYETDYADTEKSDLYTDMVDIVNELAEKLN